MGALKDLWHSERGIVGVALIVAATVLTAMHIISVDKWTEYTKWIFVTYAAAKTVTGTAAIIRRPSSGAPLGPDDATAPLPSAPSLHTGIFSDPWSDPLGREFDPNHTTIVRDADTPPTDTIGFGGYEVEVPVDDLEVSAATGATQTSTNPAIAGASSPSNSASGTLTQDKEP